MLSLIEGLCYGAGVHWAPMFWSGAACSEVIIALNSGENNKVHF